MLNVQLDIENCALNIPYVIHEERDFATNRHEQFGIVGITQRRWAVNVFKREGRD